MAACTRMAVKAGTTWCLCPIVCCLWTLWHCLSCASWPAGWAQGLTGPSQPVFNSCCSHLWCYTLKLCNAIPGCRSMQEPRANHAILEAHLRGLEGRIEECISTKADKSAVPLRIEVSLWQAILKRPG